MVFTFCFITTTLSSTFLSHKFWGSSFEKMYYLSYSCKHIATKVRGLESDEMTIFLFEILALCMKMHL